MLRKVRNFHRIYNSYRSISCSAILRTNDGSNKDKNDISSSVSTKFQVFRNESVGEILDIEEERTKLRQREELNIIEDDEQETDQLPDIYLHLNLERGKTGVFDIEDLVEVLKGENAIDLCVIRVPQNYSYVDYMVIITGSTYRHMLGMASFVRKVYKLKRHRNDPIPKIEGKGCKNWMAMDLGNIALHIFSQSAREHYNLESLWTLGEEYESRLGRKNELSDSIYDEFFSDPIVLDGKDQKLKNGT